MKPLSHPAESTSVHSTHTYTHTQTHLHKRVHTDIAKYSSSAGPAAVTLFTMKIWGIQSPCILPFKAPLSKYTCTHMYTSSSTVKENICGSGRTAVTQRKTTYSQAKLTPPKQCKWNCGAILSPHELSVISHSNKGWDENRNFLEAHLKTISHWKPGKESGETKTRTEGDLSHSRLKKLLNCSPDSLSQLSGSRHIPIRV